MRTAILCVDVQRGLVEGPLAVAGAEGLVGRLTGLLDRARAAGVLVVVVGIQSEMCVASTARGALARGYDVVLPRDGHATYDIPADDRGGVHVPAAHVARAAEWSLGDQVRTPRSVDELVFSGAS